MTTSKNPNILQKSGPDGFIKYGHIHNDQVRSSVLIQGKEALEYIAIDQTDPRKRWITSRCRGRYQVKSGDDIPKNAVGMYFDACNSDIVIRTGGRLRMEAENIDLIATGKTNTSGIINIYGNESVNLNAKKITANADESITLFTSGQMFQTALNIMSVYAGIYNRLSSKSTLKPPNLPTPDKLRKYGQLYPF